jgi:hypothetical protein
MKKKQPWIRVDKVDTEPLSRKVNLRLTQGDYGKLLELRMVLHSPSDSHTLRALVRMHWAVEQAAVRKMRRDPRQLDLLDGLRGDKGVDRG